MRPLVIAVAAILFAFPALAQRPKPAPGRSPTQGFGIPPIFEKLQRMSPKERNEALGKLPPDRARAVQDRLKGFQQMSPEERERLAEQYEWFSNLPPEKQKAMRDAFRRYSDLPAARQDKVREEFRSMRELSESDRRERMESEEFRSRFNKDDRELLEEMTRSVPE
jgi:hypothetical protein